MGIDFNALRALSERTPAKRLVISGPHDPEALCAVQDARDKGRVTATALGRELSPWETVAVRDRVDAAVPEARAEAFHRVKRGDADVWMDTGPLDGGFFSLLGPTAEKGRVLSHATVRAAPGAGRLMILTDTLIHESPGIREKIGIAENVIRLARALGIRCPRVAALSALELVNPALTSTLDAAILSKMSDRGQFGDAVIEGPLAMDNAESAAAARHKGVKSPVPGDVDVYLFPDLASAHLTAQFLSWFGDARGGGVLLGSPVPVVVRTLLEPPSSWPVNLYLGLL